MRKTVFFLLTVILLSACDKKDQMVKLAEMNLRQSVDYPKQLKSWLSQNLTLPSEHIISHVTKSRG